MLRTFLPALLLAAPLLVGCQQDDAKSPYDLSIDQGSSALKYSGELERASKQIRSRESAAKDAIGKMPTAADKVSADSDFALVEKIVDASDAAGKDGGYAAEMRRLDEARTFFEEEREDIVKKVGGAAQYAAKQGGCTADTYGPVNAALKDAVDDQIKERLRSSNDAFLLIERHKEQLGKKNVPALEDLADTVAEASYVVHGELPAAKQKLEDIAKASSEAKSALEDLVKEEQDFQKEGKRSAEETKSSETRIKAAQEQLTKLEAAEQEAKQNLADVEQRAKDLEASYDEALGKLKDAVRAKIKK